MIKKIFEKLQEKEHLTLVLTKKQTLMKKIFTLFVALFAMTFFANAQYLLQEGFEGEDVPSGWTLIDNDGDGANWYVLNNSQSESGGYNVHSGDGHITSASYASGALTPDNWLITPAINLVANSTLTFWVAGQDPSWASEYYGVFLSTTGTTVNDFNVELMTGTSTPDMTQQVINLSAYTGQTVYIAFRHFNITDMFRINLDDVEISLGNNIANVESSVNIYPIPANTMVNVDANSNINNVEIYTVSGQKVGDFSANSNTTTINTENLSTGMYMMKINTENGVINKKFSVAR